VLNPVAIRQYCQIVFENPPLGSLIALRGYAERGKDGVPYTPWINPFHANWIEGVVDFARICDQRGLAAYCVPGFVRGRAAGAADVVSLPTLCVDFDTGDIAGKCIRLIELLGSPALAVHSGGLLDGQPKTHLFWRLSGDCAAPRVARLRRAAADHVQADGSFQSPHQPIRIAGSVHRKGAPMPVTIAYQTDSLLAVEDAEQRLGGARTEQGQGPANDSEEQPNLLGFSRVVPMDELPARRINHGETDITRFEAMTRMMGMMLASIHDIDNADAVNREFDYLREWAVGHIENVERDYDLRQHWRRLLRRERWKRMQPRRPRARPRYMTY
jgi:hypothetical protein